ncbi:DUF1680-domain-containing protein [Patellaria atrata CBS 101060]|uniref:DUF1680-domain-containing protein n=1 Tax=Patellaria atrata CBS 101060 TaxID=1346257 RepID=A0A9P4VQK3_9PEZI|nr:DUF1680-domain-containing protein [Patellaria atrata CBS 101060]
MFCIHKGIIIVPPVKEDSGIKAYPFDISQVILNSGRWQQNQDRTLAYLKFVDINRLLYVFRSNHRLSTNGAQANGGWDAPDFPFRSHFQGHFLTAWAQCYAQLRDTICRDRATAFTAELLKCQANNPAAGFSTGYLSGFPESDITALEQGRLSNSNVPYYAIHKTMAGLLNVWRNIGDTNAKTVLLAMAGWVDGRTSKFNNQQMQKILGTEFGGMSEVLSDIYFQTGDERWLTVAQRFHHSAVLDPLANGRDQLNGLHANTQVPKWIGAARAFKATGNTTYQNIAKNAWEITTTAHTYAIGGNSQAEHFRAPNAIANYLNKDTAESCNSYNMLKLTRELWVMDPSSTTYFDYYERVITNQMIGQQNPADHHGHVTYFHSLQPGARRGVGPAWGGGTYSTDYNSFWCCQGTGIETNTKLMDSIYFHDESSVYVNLFTPSMLDWSQRSVTLTQTTTFPNSDTTTLKVNGTGDWNMHIRIPSWTSGAKISINGQDSGVITTSGSYASISRSWTSGDTVTVQLPMNFRLLPTNDNKSLTAVAYGPVVIVGNYGSSTVNSNPTLSLSTLKRSSSDNLEFTAIAGGKMINLSPYLDAQGFNYVTYWMTSGSLP